MRSSLMISVERIVFDPDEPLWSCVHCPRPAVVTVATGADPEPERMCPEHGLAFLTVTERSIRALWIREPERSS